MKRDWTVDAQDPEAVAEAFNEVIAIGNRIGGTFLMGTLRKEDERGHFTDEWRIHFDSYIPDAKPAIAVVPEAEVG